MYSIEITYTDRQPITFEGVRSAVYDRNTGFLKVMFHEHSTDTQININDKVLFWSKIKANEAEIVKKDLPKLTPLKV